MRAAIQTAIPPIVITGISALGNAVAEQPPKFRDYLLEAGARSR